MPISCNAVGDIIALVQLGIKVAEVLSESRKAPADCRALCNDLRSLERLIALSRPTIDELRGRTLRELVDERLDEVSRQILDGLKLICNFDAAFDVSAAHIERNWQHTIRHWGRMSKQRIAWAVKHNASAKDARVAIAQSFTSLIFALLVAFQADQRGLFETLRDAHDASTSHIAQLAQKLGTGQDGLRADISEVKSLFDKLLVTLDGVREEVSGISDQLQRNIAKTQLDIVTIRQQLHDLQTTTATAGTVERVGALTQETVERVGASTQRATQESIERLGVAVQQGFTVIETRFASGDRGRGDQDQLAAWLVANPLILVFARLLYSQGGPQIDGPSVNRSSAVPQSSQSLVARLPHEVASPPVIAATFLLALRANSGNERAAYAMLTFMLFLMSKMMQLYRTPTISHVIFVVDLFDICVEISVSDATSSASLHLALVNQFAGRLGHGLLRQRKYELRFDEDESRGFRRLPASWEGLLKPGDRISMDALVQKPKDETTITCPACSTWIADRSANEKVVGWMSCPNCASTIRLSDSTVKADEPGSADRVNANELQPDDRPFGRPGDGYYETPRPNSPPRDEDVRKQEQAIEKATLLKCRRIHVVESHLIYELLATIRDASDMYLPLKAAVIGVLKIWDVCERTMWLNREFTKHKEKLERLLKIVATHKGESGLSDNLRERLAEIAAALQDFANTVQAKLDRGLTSRVLQSTSDVSEVKALFDKAISLTEVFEFGGGIRVDIGVD